MVRSDRAWRSVPYLIECGVITKDEARRVRKSLFSSLKREKDTWRYVPYLIECGVITKEEIRKVKNELIKSFGASIVTQLFSYGATIVIRFFSLLYMSIYFLVRSHNRQEDLV